MIAEGQGPGLVIMIVTGSGHVIVIMTEDDHVLGHVIVTTINGNPVQDLENMLSIL